MEMVLLFERHDASGREGDRRCGLELTDAKWMELGDVPAEPPSGSPLVFSPRRLSDYLRRHHQALMAVLGKPK